MITIKLTQKYVFLRYIVCDTEKYQLQNQHDINLPSIAQYKK